MISSRDDFQNKSLIPIEQEQPRTMNVCKYFPFIFSLTVMKAKVQEMETNADVGPKKIIKKKPLH